MDKEIDILKSQPTLAIKKEIKVIVSCPACSYDLEMKSDKVDIGNIVTCPDCKNKTYYPFERPWYRKKKLIIGYIVSLIVSFIIGILANIATNAFIK